MVGKGKGKIGKNNQLEVKKQEGDNMKTFTIISLVCLGIFLVMGFGIAYADGEDSDTATSVVSLTVPHGAKLVISNANASKTLGQDGTAEAAFDAGYVDLDADNPNLKVSANKSWTLNAKSSGWTGPYSKDVGDLKLKDAGASHVVGGFDSFKSLALTDQTIASHTIGVKNENHPIQYEIVLDYTKDIPGDYTATVTYTLATQAS